jgi:hypothetical protein
MSTIEFPPAERVNLVGNLTRGELIGAGCATGIFGVGIMTGRLFAATGAALVIVVWTFAPNRRRPLRVTVPAALRWRLRRDRHWSAVSPRRAGLLPGFLADVAIELADIEATARPVGVVVNRRSFTVMFGTRRAALTYASDDERAQVMASWGEILGSLCVERNTEMTAERVGWTDVHRAADPAALARYHETCGVAGPASEDYAEYLSRFGTLAAEHDVVVWATVTQAGRFRLAKRMGARGSISAVMHQAAVTAGSGLRSELAVRGFEVGELMSPAEIGRTIGHALDPYRPLEQHSERERFGLADRVGPDSSVTVERDLVMVDRAHHRVFVLGFPSTPVHMSWMWQPLAVPGPKVVTTVFEPVPPSRADRERDSKRSIGSRNNQAAAGERDGHVRVRNVRKVDALLRAERAVAEGHHELDGYALVIVSGSTRDELDRHCQELRRAVRQAGRASVRELSGSHDHGLAAALPLGAHVAIDNG